MLQTCDAKRKCLKRSGDPWNLVYVESELLGPRGAFLATGYILLVFYTERI